MKWAKNIKSIADTYTVGECPFCGSSDTDYKATQISDKIGCMDIWCNDCKRWYHASRVLITENFKNFKKTGELPEGLKHTLG